MVCLVIMSPSSSFSVPPHRAHELSVLLCSLLQEEKKHTHKWLRAEMDRLVDPLVDSIFQRLTNKLVNADLIQQDRKEPEIKDELNDEQATNDKLQNEKHNLDISLIPSNHNLTDWQVENQTNHNHQQQMVNPSDHDHVHSSNPQSSTFNPECLQPHSNGDEDEYDQEILAQVKREINEEQNEMELKNAMDNPTQNQQIVDEYEEEDQVNHNTQQLVDETDNGERIEEEEDEDGEESRFMEKASIETARPLSTGQSQAFFIQSVKRKQPHKECSQVPNEADIRDNVEDIEEEEDTGDVTSRSVKRPRTTSNDAQMMKTITVTLRCDQVNCEKMIDKDQFNWHMLQEHSIRPFRCPLKDCKQSFDNTTALGHHLAQSHQFTSQWHCDKCPKYFGTYNSLSQHTTQYHQTGYFQCSFPSCTFTGEYRMKVYLHYVQLHKPPFNCHQPGCSYVALNVTNLKQHLQSHLEPYLCKWTGCHFASSTRATTLAHIRLVHLKKYAKTYSKFSTQSPQIDPNDYLKVIRFK